MKTDLIGKKFDRWTVLKRAGTQPNCGPLWLCQCECGEIRTVLGKSLKMGVSKSCGCYRRDMHIGQEPLYNKKINEVGNVYGDLTVIKEGKKDRFKQTYWICRCSCGNITEVRGSDLRQGKSKGCGHSKPRSYGMEILKSILDNNNINYIEEKTFDSCRNPKSGRMLFFDYYLPDYNCLIEYDGLQHFRKTNWCKTDSSRQEWHENLIERDKYKNDWALSNNMTMIRIPYTHEDISLDDLLPNTSTFKIEKGGFA